MNNLKKISLLNLLLSELKSLDLFPVIGTETEFYLLPEDNNLQDSLWQADKLQLNLIIEKEKGLNQFEIRTNHTRDISKAIKEVLEIRKLINNQAMTQNMKADFSAKPFQEQPGNAFHVHLHLENSKGNNLFIKNGGLESEFLLYSIGGLCATMEEAMVFFAPYKDAYARYIGNLLESPSKICWGGNNRSAAIRIPLDQKFNRRLEHRVSCSDSNPAEVICAIFYGVLRGIKEKRLPPEKLFGNAFLDQYDYPSLPKDYAQAKKLFENSDLKKFITDL
ncbi:MAG: glutamine synthetase [Pseudomonadota bacterium]